MKERAAPASPTVGPLRWSYRSYFVHERATPFGRRFEVLSPKDELVLFCRAKRSDSQLVFFADAEEKTELFRLQEEEVKPPKRFERVLKATDSLSGRPFVRFGKKTYPPSHKVEWFILNPEGDTLGLVTETAPDPSLLRRLVPVEGIFSKAWALHWGQAVAGTIQPRAGLVGERLEVDLSLDTKDEIDRRIALSLVVAMRVDAHRAEGQKT